MHKPESPYVNRSHWPSAMANAVTQELAAIVENLGADMNPPVTLDVNDNEQVVKLLLATFLRASNADFVKLTDALLPLLPAGIKLPCFGKNIPEGMVALSWKSYTLPRANYPDLVPLIGYGLGAGDGSTTLTIPALPQNYGLIQEDFSEFSSLLGTLTTGAIKSHTHGVSDPGHQHSVAHNGSYQGGGWNGLSIGDYTTIDGWFPTSWSGTGISIQAAGGNANLAAGMYTRFGLTCGRVVA